jgi:hypothetical protein
LVSTPFGEQRNGRLAFGHHVGVERVAVVDDGLRDRRSDDVDADGCIDGSAGS